MIRSHKIFVVFASLLIVPSISSAQSSQTVAPWVKDARFPAIHDMYWRARFLGAKVGDRLCSLKELSRYDHPQSPFRPLDQRLKAVGNRINIIWPNALNVVARPYEMPPSQRLCDDERSAWDALFAMETAVTATERLLDNYSDTPRAR